LVRRIKLSWKRRSQILGSVLHWAHDAGASRIDFDPTSEEPFTYTTSDGRTVTTELGNTPPEYVDSIAQFIRDTIDGHPMIRQIRRLYRTVTNTAVEVEIEIPPTKTYTGSTWICRMDGDTATFGKLSIAKPTQNAS